MQKFKVEFSKLNEKFGTFYLSKLVRESSDELLGLSSKKSYFIWGTKELEGDIELDIADYITKTKSFVGKEGDEITLEYIVARK